MTDSTIEISQSPLSVDGVGTQIKIASVSLTISGTPSGRREYFYNISRNKDLPAFDFHEHHIPSMESPATSCKAPAERPHASSKAADSLSHIEVASNPNLSISSAVRPAVNLA